MPRVLSGANSSVAQPELSIFHDLTYEVGNKSCPLFLPIQSFAHSSWGSPRLLTQTSVCHGGELALQTTTISLPRLSSKRAGNEDWHTVHRLLVSKREFR